MKKIENNFAVTGFVGKDAEIRQFANSSVARFSLAISRQEKNGEETTRTSAFVNAETWRKNDHTESFDHLTKGTLLTVEGYFKPEEWTYKDGVKRNCVIMVATKFYPAPENRRKANADELALSAEPQPDLAKQKEETPKEEEKPAKQTKKAKK